LKPGPDTARSADHQALHDPPTAIDHIPGAAAR
jgi:hypothetical protein